jgi:hypothetical protein
MSYGLESDPSQKSYRMPLVDPVSGELGSAFGPITGELPPSVIYPHATKVDVLDHIAPGGTEHAPQTIGEFESLVRSIDELRDRCDGKYIKDRLLTYRRNLGELVGAALTPTQSHFYQLGEAIGQRGYSAELHHTVRDVFFTNALDKPEREEDLLNLYRKSPANYFLVLGIMYKEDVLPKEKWHEAQKIAAKFKIRAERQYLPSEMAAWTAAAMDTYDELTAPAEDLTKNIGLLGDPQLVVDNFWSILLNTVAGQSTFGDPRFIKYGRIRSLITELDHQAQLMPLRREILEDFAIDLSRIAVGSVASLDNSGTPPPDLAFVFNYANCRENLFKGRQIRIMPNPPAGLRVAKAPFKWSDQRFAAFN